MTSENISSRLSKIDAETVLPLLQIAWAVLQTDDQKRLNAKLIAGIEIELDSSW